MANVQIANRLKGTEANVWVEFTDIVARENPLDLGRGFPNYGPPTHVKEALIETVTNNEPFNHQYSRVMGHKRLVKALAELYSPIINHEIDWESEVLITNGAYGGLYYSINGIVNPGDEVIIIEPYFDCYEPMVKHAGGKPIFLPLKQKKSDSPKSSDFVLDFNELSSAITNKTKLLIFNNPNNPIGKVYTLEECEKIADICKKNDVIILSDEVYEWITYGDKNHIKIASLPGMFDRTLTLGSAGKSFSVTGWKIGWIIAPKNLIKGCTIVHQNVSNSCPTPLQEALGILVEKEAVKLRNRDKNCYFISLAKEIEPKRDFLEKALINTGFQPIRPDGGYFILTDYLEVMKKSGIQMNESVEAKDSKFVKWMVKNKKLSAIPVSVFYSKDHKHIAENLIRFCFIKSDETLSKAEELLKNWSNNMK